ncbi:unnamed protein product [Lactuca virosa]|uniref:PB1-like domain-containing protein n=1 Tax=Lactuca virosa TaxID=75947 RepID=A0AAU9PLQ9_9ASTR|nr:unnamed protein product [Lactuca virosa]
MAFDGVNWIVRDSSQYILPDELYGTENTCYFSMKIYHGGHFFYNPNRSYDGGIIEYVDFCNINNYSIQTFQKIISTLGYEFHNTFCYSLVTYAPLDVGLNKLQYVLDISDFVEKVKNDGLFCVQEIYVEHFVKTVSIYFPHTLNMASNSCMCTLLYKLVVSNPNVNVWEARINMFDNFKIWIDVHKIHEALEYTKHQVKLFKN